MKILLIILCFILPPLAVYLATKCAKSTIINLILCFLFYIPGLVHALWTVLKGATASPASAAPSAPGAS